MTFAPMARLAKNLQTLAWVGVKAMHYDHHQTLASCDPSHPKCEFANPSHPKWLTIEERANEWVKARTYVRCHWRLRFTLQVEFSVLLPNRISKRTACDSKSPIISVHRLAVAMPWFAPCGRGKHRGQAGLAFQRSRVSMSCNVLYLGKDFVGGDFQFSTVDS